MAFGFLGELFGGTRLPADQVTRTPRAAKKAASDAIAGMAAALEKISAMPGIADIKENKVVPRGFYETVQAFLKHADEYHATARKYFDIPDDAKRPGEPGGTGACYAAPMGLSNIEVINLYRAVRTWRDFQQVARRLGELGEQQFKDIQAGHAGRDPEKIRLGSKAVRQGRLQFAQRLEPCPFLNVEKDRCRVWDNRPMVCRMHHPITPAENSRPDHSAYPKGVKAKNIRLPVKQQVALTQLDKRLTLQLSPFMYAGVLQLLQLTEGQMLLEVGEAPMKMQQDGHIAQRANRNKKGAKKFKKGGKRKKRK